MAHAGQEETSRRFPLGLARAAILSLQRMSPVREHIRGDRCERLAPLVPGIEGRSRCNSIGGGISASDCDRLLLAQGENRGANGNREGRFFHGYYDCYCYLPLYVFCGDQLLWAQLRKADIDPSDGAPEVLQRLVKMIRHKWPLAKILVRADSGFCRDALMSWCEANGVFFLFGMAKTALSSVWPEGIPTRICSLKSLKTLNAPISCNTDHPSVGHFTAVLQRRIHAQMAVPSCPRVYASFRADPRHATGRRRSQKRASSSTQTLHELTPNPISAGPSNSL